MLRSGGHRSFAALAVAVLAVTVLTVGGVLSLAAPATAADVDSLPINTIIGPHIQLSGAASIAVAPNGTTYVGDTQGNQVDVYPAGSTGNAPSAPSIPLISQPVGLAVDSHGNLWIADQANGYAGRGELFEFAAGSSGLSSPIALIRGQHTLLNFPTGIALDSAGNVFVSNEAGSIEEFAKGASGDVPPIRTIAGALTTLSSVNFPRGIAIAQDGSIVVPAGNAIDVFDAHARDDTQPLRQITGTDTGLDQPRSVTIDHAGTIYVANGGSDSITEYPGTANGDQVPTTRMIGPDTALDGIASIALDSHDNLWVVNRLGAAGSIVEFPANLEVISVTPNRGSPAGGQTVTIHGYGIHGLFVGSITFGGQGANNFRVSTAQSVTVITPAHAAGTVAVTLSPFLSGAPATLADGYTYATPASLPTAATLPTTGIDPGLGLDVSLAFLGVGAGLLAVRRQRRTKPGYLVAQRMGRVFTELFEVGRRKACKVTEPPPQRDRGHRIAARPVGE